MGRKSAYETRLHFLLRNFRTQERIDTQTERKRKKIYVSCAERIKTSRDVICDGAHSPLLMSAGRKEDAENFLSSLDVISTSKVKRWWKEK